MAAQPAAPAGVAPAELSAEEERRRRLKAAGEAYFAKVLNQSKGKELLTQAKSAASLGGGGGTAGGGGVAGQALPLTTFDEDFLQAGAVIEGARTYVLGTIYGAAQAVQLVFLKSSLEALHTPALMLFLHFLPVATTLWLLSAQGVLELRPFSLRAVQGSLVAAALTGAQTLALYWAVLRTPVFLVLCWTVTTPHLVHAARDVALGRGMPQPIRSGGLAVALACMAATLLVQFPGLLGLLALLVWTAIEGLTVGWAQLVQQPDLLVDSGAAAGQQRLAGSLRQLAEAQGGVDSATLAFMRHALPPLPVLVLGLLLQEGRELIDHELSVPAVTMILLSCLALTLAVASNQLIMGSLTRQAHAALSAAGQLGTVVTETAVHGLGSPIAFAAALACSLAGVLLRIMAAGAS